GSKHWVTLVENSSLVGMKPIDLQHQYNVMVQALRRQGKLYNPVDEAGVLQVGDCVLLSGEWDEE
ncbi:TrkA C-terminal domain-containing protein, partial [Moorena sp. SIO3B2]